METESLEEKPSDLQLAATAYAESVLNMSKQKSLLIESNNYEVCKQLLILGYMEGFLIGHNFQSI